MSARPATTEDAAEVVRLARLMFESLDIDCDETPWQSEGAEHVRRRLGLDLMVFVVDDPDEPGRLVAAAAGTIATRLPTPHNPAARAGYVQWVSTERAFRRRGSGEAVMRRLLDWYDTEGVAVVELHATPDGEPLYRSLGFADDAGGKALRRSSRRRSAARRV
jgi:GNAT superfamily N-acetyltransferase